MSTAMRSLAIGCAAAALALACDRPVLVTDTTSDGGQTYREAADELAADVAAGVSAPAQDESKKKAE